MAIKTIEQKNREQAVFENIKFSFKDQSVIGGVNYNITRITFHDRRFMKKYEIIINEISDGRRTG